MHQCTIGTYVLVGVLSAVFGPLIAVLIMVMRGNTQHIKSLGITFIEIAIGEVAVGLLIAFVECSRT